MRNSEFVKSVHERERKRLYDWARIWLNEDDAGRAVCSAMTDLMYMISTDDKVTWGPLGFLVKSVWSKILVRGQLQDLSIPVDGMAMMADPTEQDVLDAARVYALLGHACQRAGIGWTSRYHLGVWVEQEYGLKPLFWFQDIEDRLDVIGVDEARRIAAELDTGHVEGDPRLDAMMQVRVDQSERGLEWVRRRNLGKGAG